MLEQSDQEYFASQAIKHYLQHVECENVKEMIEALTVLLSRSAFLIEHKADTEAAQLALYEPYSALNNRVNE